MTTRQEKRAKRSQLIHQLQRLEIQHQRLNGPDFIISQCEGCDICTKIRAIGKELSPDNVDICTASGLTLEGYKNMQLKGMTDKEIASNLMVTPTSLGNWKKKNNISMGSKSPIFNIPVERYINLRDKGLTHKEIRIELNCSMRTLERWLSRNGMSNTKRRLNNE